MWELLAGHVDQRCRFASVIGMAIVTRQYRRTFTCKLPMESRNLAHLRGNVGMTGCAAVGHGRRLPGGRMTGAAVSSHLRVRTDVSEDSAGLVGVQGARAEQ